AAAEPAVETEARPAESQAERGALIVLDTVAHLDWGIGGGKLAQVLKGSSGADMTRYQDVRNFGKFSRLRLSEIEGLIGQLLDGAFLRQVGGGRPVLALTKKGDGALQTRSAIQVSLRSVRPAAEQRAAERRAAAKAAAGSTVQVSGDLLRGGLNPEQVA